MIKFKPPWFCMLVGVSPWYFAASAHVSVDKKHMPHTREEQEAFGLRNEPSTLNPRP